MPYDLSNLLVVGVSSRALFNLEAENKIFETKGLPSFLEFQRSHELDVLAPGTGFGLIQSLLGVNSQGADRRVEVIIMSRNHPDVHLRVSDSIRHHKLDITRAILTGGEPLHRYLAAYKVDLFLSASEEDVRSALKYGIAAGRILTPPKELPSRSNQIRIAFDGDCVLFSDEAERINSNSGLEAFHRHERANASVPLPDGPFAKLIRTISMMQGSDPERSPFRIGLVTARNYPSHERAIRTLRSWNVRIDGAAFLGGLPKDGWLIAFQPQIFFEDQEGYCRAASPHVPTAQVPFPLDPLPSQLPLTTLVPGPARKNRFLLVCRGYLKKREKAHTPVLEQWYEGNLATLEANRAEAFLEELEQSVQGTPAGKERPAKGESNLSVDKLVDFLNALRRKHSR